MTVIVWFRKEVTKAVSDILVTVFVAVFHLQPAVDSAKMKNYIKKAVRQAAEYNASLMREKREERQYYLDLQTMVISDGL